MNYFVKGNKASYRILLVDDDQEFLDLIKNTMGSRGDIELVTTVDPENGIQMIQDSNFDCVISDYNMPEISGLDLLKQVKSLNENIPFILLTGAGGEEIASRAISEGVDDYILKENAVKNLDVISRRIKNTIKSKSAENAARAIIDRVSDAFFALDKNWNFTYVNEQAEIFLQKKEDDLIGESVWDQFSEARNTKFQQKYEEAMEKQEPVYFEEYFPPLDTWFSVRAFPSDSGLSVYFDNIDDRKQWENHVQSQLQQQRTMKDLLRMALEGMQSAELQQKAAKMVANAVNMEYCQIAKFDEDDDCMVLAASHGVENPKIGQKISDRDYPDQINLCFRDRELIAVEDFLHQSEVKRTKTQEYLGIRSGISALIGELENPWGVISLYSQKTHQFSENDKEFLQSIASVLGTAIENQEQRIELKEYKQAIDSLQEGVYLLDSKSRFVFVNSAFENLSGYSEEKLRGKKPSIIEESVNGDNKLKTVLKTEDGDEIRVETKLSSIEMPDGTRGKVAVIHPVENSSSESS